MKILSCHIENFGAISNRDFEFDANLTQFVKENGYGKTTLAAFLKAMFYGLPSSTGRTKFNDRQHYYPFNGGKFGGNITFTSRGKTYRIERFFDKHSDSRDECRVFINNALSQNPGDIGRLIFGLDEASFERTVFIDASEIEISSTSGINAKLNSVIDATEGDTDFTSALGIIESARKDLRASRGNNDRISRQSANIARLQEEVANYSAIERNLGELYHSRSELDKEVRALEARENRAYENALEEQKWQSYEEYLSNAERVRERIKEINSLYPAGLPNREELAELSQAAGSLSVNAAALESCIFPEERANALNELEAAFNGCAPTEEVLEAAQNRITELGALRAEIESMRRGNDSERMQKLKKRFENTPDENTLEKMRAKAEEYKLKEEKIRTFSAVSESGAIATKKHKTAYIVGAIFSALMIAGGAAALFMYTIIGVALLVAGVVALAVTGFLYFNSQVKRVAQTPAAMSAELEELQAEQNVLRDSLRAFLVPFGYYSENGVIFDFATFEADYAEFKRIQTQNTEREITEKIARHNNAVKILNGFFADYGVTGENYQVALNALVARVREYESLTNERAAISARREKLNAEAAQIKHMCGRILLKYNIYANFDAFGLQVRTLENACDELARLSVDMAEITRRAEEYRRANSLNERPENIEAAADVSEELSEKRTALARLDRRIEDDERNVELLAEKEAELSEEKEKFAEMKARFRLLTAAKQMLEEAEQNLKSRYVAPIKDKFETYSRALEKTLGEKISMGENFRISFERAGEYRSDGHLSAGQRAVCMLCFRLALVDNVFEGEKPFIIMDDPFVSLDEAHMQKVRGLMKSLSADKQIIYFCCHESRAI